ncbi:MAG TPA: type 4a pilus biogenesis protein PilO [Gammaproteobacteria bacterium]|nr:type 4a pilus biogenesis protein PilO [Gammaproteobacteria bacterium]
MTLDELQSFLKDPDSIKKIGVAPLPIRIGAVVIIVALILVGGYFKIIKPVRENIAKLQQKEEELKKDFDQQQRKASNLEAYQEQLEEMKRSFGAMLRQLPNKTEVESLLVDLSQASAANNLKVDYFKPTGEVAKEFYAEYPITLRVFGHYHELAKFVSDVAALPRIVTLHDIEIKPVKADSNTGDLTMEMTAKTYHYLEDNPS